MIKKYLEEKYQEADACAEFDGMHAVRAATNEEIMEEIPDYQDLAMRTCAFNGRGIEGLKDLMLYHAVFGLTAEAGEVAGIMQKVYQGHPDPLKDDAARQHVLSELGDCLWMIAEACEALGSDIDEAMGMNITKLQKRYPKGFEAEKSLHRQEGDI